MQGIQPRHAFLVIHIGTGQKYYVLEFDKTKTKNIPRFKNDEHSYEDDKWSDLHTVQSQERHKVVLVAVEREAFSQGCQITINR